MSPEPASAANDSRVVCHSCADGAGGTVVVALAWVTAEAAAHRGLEHAWLGRDEQARAARFLVDRARRDFLAGRVAAKSAVGTLRGRAELPANWDIVRGEHHQPVLSGTCAGLKVTLAHAGGVGIAVAHRDHVVFGVDLEALARDAADVIATQVSPAEAAWARAGREAANVRWMLLWTAREALGKSAGTGLLDTEVLRPSTGWRETPVGWRAAITGRSDVGIGATIAERFAVSFIAPQTCGLDDVLAWTRATLDGFPADVAAS